MNRINAIIISYKYVGIVNSMKGAKAIGKYELKQMQAWEAVDGTLCT